MIIFDPIGLNGKVIEFPKSDIVEGNMLDNLRKRLESVDRSVVVLDREFIWKKVLD